MKTLNKKEIFIKSIPLLLTLLSCVLLISYAYYKIKLEGQKEHFISTDTISFSYIENEDKISITSVNPLSDTDGKAQNNYFDFNLSSNATGTINLYYYIYFTIDPTSTLANDYIKVYLTDGGNNQIVEPTYISDLVPFSLDTFTYDANSNNYLLHTDNFSFNENASTQIKYYRFRMWYSEDRSSNNITITDSGNDNNSHQAIISGGFLKLKINIYSSQNELTPITK